MMSMRSDPIFAILGIKPTIRLPNSMKFQLADDQRPGEFPEFKQKDLLECYELVLKGGLSYAEVLRKVKFDFPFRPDLFPCIVNWRINENNINDKSNIVDYQCKFILFTFVAWQLNRMIEHLQAIVDSLTSILEYTNNYEEMALRAIEFSFQESIQNSPVDDFNIIFPIFKNFFLKFPEKAMKMQHLLVLFLRPICSINNADSEPFSGENLKIKSFVDFLLDFCPKTADHFLPQTIDGLLSPITSKIVQLDLKYLTLFKIFSKNASAETAVSITVLFLMPITSAVEKEGPFLVPLEIIDESNKLNIEKIISSKENVKILKDFSANIKGQFRYVPIETFKQGLDIKTALNFSEKISLKLMFRESFYKRIKLIAEALKFKEDTMNLLFDWLSEIIIRESAKNSKYSLDYIAIFIVLYKNWKNSKLTEKFWNILFKKTIIFDDRINASIDPNSNVVLIDQLRSIVFSVLAEDGFSSLCLVFDSFKTKPSLIGELIHRVMAIYDKVDIVNLQKAVFIRTISAIAIYFQDLNFHCESSLIPFVEATRSSAFLFISKVFQDTNICSVWMAQPVFCTSFFTFIFEPPVRPIILKMLKFYLIDAKSPLHLKVIEGIKEICSISFTKIPNQQYVLIGCDTLSTLNDFMTQVLNSSTLFSDMAESIKNAVSSLDRSDYGGDFLIQAIYFFAITSTTRKLCNIELCSLAEATKKIFANEPPNAIFSKYIQLLAGAPLSSISPYIIIKQPKALKTLVSVYQKSSQFADILRFIYSIISYSYENSVAANSVSFGVELLNLVQLHKNDYELSDDTINVLFSIVSHISCLIGSVPVVQKFISLLCPIEGRYLSHYEPLFIQKINEIIGATNKSPNAWLPLKESSASYISVENLSSSDIPKLFSLVFWINIDQISSQSHKFIFEFSDRKSRGISAFISSGSLLVTVINKTVESTARCEIPLPVRTWTPIIFKIALVKKNKTIIIPIIDHYVCRRLEFAWDGFKEGKISLKLGKSSDEPCENGNRDIASHAFFSSLAFISDHIDSGDVDMLCDSGPRTKLSVLKNALFGVSLDISRGELFPETFGNISAKVIGPPIICHRSFCDVLLMVYKAEVFLPLFSMFDMPTISFIKNKNYSQNETENKNEIKEKSSENNDEVDNSNIKFIKNDENVILKEIPELTIDLLSSILLLGPDVQRCFDEANGFKIIAHLICNSKEFKPSYSSYIRFYNLLLSLTYQPLQKSLIKEILTNFKLLQKLERAVQVRIVKHWTRTLFNSSVSFFSDIHPIKSLLAAILVYFNDSDKACEEIRSYLYLLIKNILNERISSEDFNDIVLYALKSSNSPSSPCSSNSSSPLNSSCLSNPPSSLSSGSLATISTCERPLFVLKLLISVLQSGKESNINVIRNNFKTIYNLNYVLLKNNENVEIFASLIDFVIALHNEWKNEAFTLQQHFDIIQQQFIKPSVVTKELFERLIGIVNQRKVVELLPICCFIAANIDDDTVNSLFNKLEPIYLPLNPLICILCLACCSPFDVRTVIIRYVLNSMIDSDLDSIFNPIEVVSSCFSDDFLKHEVLLQLSELLLQEKRAATHDNYDNFFRFAFFSIFFHQKYRTRVMENEFANSPFRAECKHNIIPKVSPNTRRKECPTNINSLRAFSVSSKLNTIQSKKMNMNLNVIDNSIISSISNLCESESDSESIQKVNGSIMNNTSISIIKLSERENNKTIINNICPPSSLCNFTEKGNYIKNCSNITNTKANCLYNSSKNKKNSQTDLNKNTTKKNTKETITISSSCSFDSFSEQDTSIENLEFFEDDEFSLPPNYFSEKIRLFSHNHREKIFLIRTDKNGRWLDDDVAVSCIKLFDKWADPLYLDFAFLMIAYLLKFHQNPQEFDKHLEALSPNAAQIKAHSALLHLIVKNSIGFKRKLGCRYLPESLDQQQAFKGLLQIQISRKHREKNADTLVFNCAENFIKAHDKSQAIIDDVILNDKIVGNSLNNVNKKASSKNDNQSINYYMNEIVEKVEIFSKKLISDFIIHNEESKEINEKLWMRYWRSITFELAPWETAVVKSSRSLYERDLLMNKSMVNSRMRRKLHFEEISLSSKINYHSNKINDIIANVTSSGKNSPIHKGGILTKHCSSYECIIISPRQEKEAILEINSNFVRFIIKSKQYSPSKGGIRKIHGNIIRLLMIRSRFNKYPQTAFEMVLHNGKTYFVDLKTKHSLSAMKEIADFATNLEKPPLYDAESALKLANITNLWETRKISNFDYLMMLNNISGRSFNDLTQYPIFPWVISNFDSEKLDLDDDDNFRDLRKPVMALNDDRMTKITKNNGFGKIKAPVFPESVKNFLYRSPYNANVEPQSENLDKSLVNNSENNIDNNLNSNSDSNLDNSFEDNNSDNNLDSSLDNNSDNNLDNSLDNNFANNLINSCTNDNKKDKDRDIIKEGQMDVTNECNVKNDENEIKNDQNWKNHNKISNFNSISNTYRSVTSDYNDFRELIPEFFFFPDFLCETDFCRSVSLPKWSKSPIDFVYHHRKALESEFVSSTLNFWIDLIFGFKQQGMNAKSASNTYPRELFESGNEDIIRISGHLPQQLFTKPHPQREYTLKRSGMQHNVISSSSSSNTSSTTSSSSNYYNNNSENNNNNKNNIVHNIITADAALNTETSSSSSSNSEKGSKDSSKNWLEDEEPYFSQSEEGNEFDIFINFETNFTGTVFSLFDISKAPNFLTFSIITRTGKVHTIEIAFLKDQTNNTTDNNGKNNNSNVGGNNSKFTYSSHNIKTVTFDSSHISKDYIMDTIVPICFNPNGYDNYTDTKLNVINDTDDNNDNNNSFNDNDYSGSNSNSNNENNLEQKQGFAITNTKEDVLLVVVIDHIGSSSLNRIPFGSIRSIASSGNFIATVGTDMMTRVMSISQILKQKQQQQKQQQYLYLKEENFEKQQQQSEGSQCLPIPSANLSPSNAANASCTSVSSNSSKPSNSSTFSNSSVSSNSSISATNSNANSSSLGKRSSSGEEAKQIYCIPSYRGETSCVAISTNYNIIVSGIRDGTMQVCNLITGEVQKVVSLGKCRPLHIAISDGWGFIVVFTEKSEKQTTKLFELFLYTINGQFINKCRIENEITAWETWTDRRGFDFVAVAIKGGKILSFELYYMEPGATLCRAASDIVSIKYIGCLNAIAFVTANGKITIRSV